MLNKRDCRSLTIAVAQVHFAEALKKAHPALPVGTVGLITGPLQAESYLKSGQADVVFLARELIRNPHWPLTAAKALNFPLKAANQYERGWEWSTSAPAAKSDAVKHSL